MQIAFGGVLGCLLGLGICQLGRQYVARAKAPAPPDSPEPRSAPNAKQGAFTLPGLLTVAAMAFWGVYVGWRSVQLSQVVLVLAFTALLVVLSWADFGARRLPNALLLALLALAIIQALWSGHPNLASASLGLLVGGGLFLLLALVGRGAMGTGDVKLAAALGAVLGYPLILPALLIGVVAGGAAALVLLVTHRARRKDFMAYGPYLALGAWIVWTRAAGVWP